MLKNEEDTTPPKLLYQYAFSRRINAPSFPPKWSLGMILSQNTTIQCLHLTFVEVFFWHPPDVTLEHLTLNLNPNLETYCEHVNCLKNQATHLSDSLVTTFAGKLCCLSVKFTRTHQLFFLFNLNSNPPHKL